MQQKYIYDNDNNYQNNNEEYFISDFNSQNLNLNLNKFIYDLFNHCKFDKENKEINESIENPLEIPRIKKIINFVLSNLCENFNTNINIDFKNKDNNNDFLKIKKSIYYLLWEDIFYNFIGITGIFYEIKDQNLSLLIDKICLISQALDKKDFIDKLIVNYIIN